MRKTWAAASRFFLVGFLSAMSLWPTVAAGATSRVAGRVYHLERIALPPGRVVRVELLDVSRMDAPAETIAAAEYRPRRQSPVPYSLSYDRRRIDPSHRYVVRATILVNGRMIFTSTRMHPVITQGAPNNADILVQHVASPR